jgi:hypothetical protein
MSSFRTLLPAFSLALLLGALPTTVARANDVAGNALELDGIDDIARVPYDVSLDMTDELTAEAWVRPISQNGGVVGMWGAGGIEDKFLLYWENEAPRGRIVRDGEPGSVTAVGQVLAPGAWHHVAMTYDGATLRLYVDGFEVSSVGAVGTIPEQPGLDLRMGIEDISFGTVNFFRGSIDEVRVWSVARTQAELFTYMNQTVAPDAPGLVGMWRCDEAAPDQTLVDGSTAGNDGTLGDDAAAAADDPVRVVSTAPMRWEHLGNALPGNLGPPSLHGQGTLVPASFMSLTLQNANPGALASLVLGFTELSAPFKGGVMVPNPDLILGPIPVDATGSAPLGGLWPGGLPARFELYLQYWIPDAVGPAGFAASNGLLAETP